MRGQSALKIENSGSRNAIGVGICVVSATLGALALRRGWSYPDNIACFVACVWTGAGLWLAGRLNYRRLNTPLSAIYRDAKLGKLPKDPPLACAISVGGHLLVVAWIVLLVIRLRS